MNSEVRLSLLMLCLGIGAVQAQYRIETVAGGGVPDSSPALSMPVHRGTVTVGPSGELYVTYEGAVYRNFNDGTLVRVAGGYSSAFSGDGGPATSAGLNPAGLAVDAAGNILVADASNNRVRRVDARTGIISTIAGNGSAGFRGDGDLATNASLNSPRWLLLDVKGNLFVSDTGNNRVRRVDAETGIISTFAGGNFISIRRSLVPALYPAGLVLDPDGNLLIADDYYNRVQRLDKRTGMLTTIAGTGSCCFSGDGGPAVNANLFQPAGLVLDIAGNLLIADTQNNRVRKVDLSTGAIGTIAGGGSVSRGFSGDGGPAISATLSFPTGLALDATGNLFIGDSLNVRVRRVDANSALITTVAGNGEGSFSGDGGPATSASFWAPYGLALDTAGNLFIADQFNNRVRRMDAQTGVITTVAGSGLGSFSGDGGPAEAASLYWPHALALDAAGNLFIIDQLNNRVRRVDARTGIISTVVGDGTRGFGGDGGPATSASLNFPNGLALDASGNLFIADQQNQRVRRVDARTGIISTIAGNGLRGLDQDGEGHPATEVSFFYPHGLALDMAGNLFIADEGGCRVRRVDAQSGMITTVAGIGSRGFSGDGGPATGAILSGPTALALDAAGNLFIADMNNDRIRRVDARTGIITTIAGDGNESFSGDDGPATRASLHEPYGLAVDAIGNVYVSDTYNSRVRKLTPEQLSTSAFQGRPLGLANDQALSRSLYDGFGRLL